MMPIHNLGSRISALFVVSIAWVMFVVSLM